MRKALSVLVMMSVLLAALAGCAAAPSSQAASQSTPAPETSAAASESQPQESSQPESRPAASGDALRIGGLKGPTTMGMVKLMNDEETGTSALPYSAEVTMYGTPDEIVPKLVSGELDAAAIPANLASVLYNQTQGKIKVAAINTLGVLYVVETGDTIQSFEDLRGKTVYSTGKGTTPEYAFNYLLAQNGLDPASDLTVEYKSESTEIAALLAAGQDAVAVLPQPYVTAVQAQNENVRVALSFSDEWERVGEGSSLVTGVLVVRSEVLEEKDITPFLEAYQSSIEWVNQNPAEAAELVVQYGIMENAALAEKAIPQCSLVFISNTGGGSELQTQLGGYLQVLYDQNPEAVGGTLPGDDFYYSGAAS